MRLRVRRISRKRWLLLLAAHTQSKRHRPFAPHAVTRGRLDGEVRVLGSDPVVLAQQRTSDTLTRKRSDDEGPKLNRGTGESPAAAVDQSGRGCGRGRGSGWTGPSDLYGGARGGGRRLWTAPVLGSKAWRNISLSSEQVDLGFEFQRVGPSCPKLTSVDPSGPLGQAGCQPGESLLRINFLDAAVLSEEQIREMLANRPLSLRVGTA
eukprot:gnl/TRDRNA2_/TRDRNA2_95013_c0_seq3.p1 gnl/TRDRNA2_/TRDRNA2_95013_c0~~gnl/TRDRNA2_/TRDRNA2_95013_c0_seq3.p1  ORF type:complete len:220 (-),score=18.87 gnl/TRDRNA2_/TRDRNA2_95013_c0_seq3:123-746(-)